MHIYMGNCEIQQFDGKKDFTKKCIKDFNEVDNDNGENETRGNN